MSRYNTTLYLLCQGKLTKFICFLRSNYCFFVKYTQIDDYYIIQKRNISRYNVVKYKHCLEDIKIFNILKCAVTFLLENKRHSVRMNENC